MSKSQGPVLYVIACGGRPAGSLVEVVPRLQQQGWHVCVIATPSALKFLDVEALTRITGHVVRSDYKQPDEPDVLPPANAMAVAPATFNTMNKLAGGISDTLALGLLNEAVGLQIPVVAVPTPNVALARHPRFVANVNELRSWGVQVLFDPDKFPLPTPNQGPSAAALFPWRELLRELEGIRAAVQSSTR